MASNKIFSVSEINKYIKSVFETDFLLAKGIIVEGEASNVKYHSSGHIYFAIKDLHSELACVMFRSSVASGLSFKLKDGDKIRIYGKLSVYEQAGRYQIYASKIEDAGVGDMLLKIEELKKKLESEGLFDKSHKKPIPKYIKRLGVVTAKTGAAIRDIVKVTRNRNPGCEIILFSSLVQGSGAPESIVAGIESLDMIGVDVIIVGRGGGSKEDLLAFNDEAVARAIYACDTPIISAVGHEIDYSISDFVADVRAATPSNAAEIAVFSRDEVRTQFEKYSRELSLLVERKIAKRRLELSRYKNIVEAKNPESIINDKRRYLMDIEDKMIQHVNDRLVMLRHKIDVLGERLEGNSPVKRLMSGYLYVTADGDELKSIHDVSVDDEIKVYMADGSMIAKVKSKDEDVVWAKK